MIEIVRVFFICSCFLHTLWCENITNSCQPDDVHCQINGKNVKNISNSESTADDKVHHHTQNISETTGRARSMNTVDFQDNVRNNDLKTGSSMFKSATSNTKEHRIDDVSMDDMEDDFNMNFTSIMSNMHLLNDMIGSNAQVNKNTSISICKDNDKVYKLGEKFDRGCEQSCQCQKDGEIQCSLKCKLPMHVKGSNKNTECVEEPVEGNSCCVLHRCATIPDLETEPIEICFHKNESYKRGSTFKDDCKLCVCEAGGMVSCKSRCPVQNATESCLTLPDPKDPCCPIVLCDVEGHDVNKIGTTVSEDSGSTSGVSSSNFDNQIISAKALNTTSVALTFAEKLKDCIVEVSLNGVDWETKSCDANNIVNGLEPGKKYHFRLKNSASNKVEVALMPSADNNIPLTMCTFKGKTYKLEEEFYDGCDAFCVCEKSGVECAPFECPTDFGLDVIDPHCLDWETHPTDFVPSPPNCCPEKVQCRDNGSCTYNGENFHNWSELPIKATGCEKRCFCEMGNITCQPMCPPISETPPKNLHCPPEQAVLAHPPGDSCCSVWTCPAIGKTGNAENNTSTKKEQDSKLALDNEHSTINTKQITPIVTSSTNIPTLKSNVTDNVKKPHLIATKNVTDKNEYYPGPFSPQYFAKNENFTVPEHKNKKADHQILHDLLSPFHLEKYAGDIEKDLHTNLSTPVISEKKPNTKKPIKDHFADEEEEDVDEEEYDEKNQYSNLFADIFLTKGKNKNSSKHPPWHKISNISSQSNSASSPAAQSPRPAADHDESKGTVVSEPSSTYATDYTKKYYGLGISKENKKQKPSSYDPNKNYEIKIADNAANNFLPYPNIPYTIPENAYTNSNPHLKYPQSEILISQTAQNPNVNYANNFKPASINDPNQAEEFYHIIDNDAYNEDQIRQTLHYPQQEIQHPQFANGIVKLNKGGSVVQVQNSPSNEANAHINVENVLTHLHHSTANNAHLPNLLVGPQRPQMPIIHNFGAFSNYRETLNAAQTSHPLLLQPELAANNSTNRDEIKIHVLEPVDENTVRLVFSVPPLLVGLHGRVELRYTSDQLNNEPSTWEQQILAPPNDLIATQELEFDLNGLLPNTTYKIKISVMMRDVNNAPTSPILTITTPSAAIIPTTLPPIIPVEPDLRTVEVNSTYAKVTWRTFSDFELQFIDGVQLRYKELDDKVYAATPLIHRAVTTYTIEQLKSDSIYEVGIFFIPFPGQTTELQAHRTIQVRTSIENDPYKFEVMVDVHHIKTTSVEISWSGVPYPEDKYVNIFRAIYQSDSSREDFNSFKVAKRDSTQSIMIQDLKPGTRYRLWLEAYLTNGRTKKSNVKDFITKIGPSSHPSTSQGKLEGMPLAEANTYYGPLIAVSLIATLAVTSTIVLLLILAKKYGTNKAPITTPINRKNNSSAAYDNPSYKTYENDRMGNLTAKNGTIALSVFPKTHMEKEA